MYYAGASDAVVAAGVLHDVIEDTAAAASDLQRRFGRRVTDLVVAVSEDDRIADFDARKAALRSQVAASGHDALECRAREVTAPWRDVQRARMIP